MMSAIVVAIGLPVALAAAIALAGSRWVRLTQVVALAGPAAALVAGISLLGRPHGAGPASWSAAWLSQGAVSLPVGFAGDALAAVMLVIVGVVAGCVVVFSWGYMAHESGRPRYFAMLMLFVAAMSALVTADNLVTLFIGWELVGACSYLLIGFWYRKPEATRAAIKAFMTTRVGDVAMLLGMAVLWRAAQTLSISEIVRAVPELPGTTVSAAALLLFVGAAGKSAQFPLHIWLPDAMEGPTPVSALIHAATMVASGVFLVARTWPVFAASPAARGAMLAVGTFTALYAAVVALAQSDIKKMLAYSTISQLGFMFAALGAGAWGAAMFHLTTHAAFKALLFLAAGSVIHGAGTQDMHEMGGLAKSMPLTAATWAAGAFALSGWWPFAGFFSKDAVIAAVAVASPAASWALVATSALTALYVWRATFRTFMGAPRGQAHAHESGPAMAVPLVVLAVGALGAGRLARPFAELLGSHEVHPSAATLAGAVAAVVLGTAGAFLLSRRETAHAVGGEPSGLASAAKSGFGFDAFVQRAVVQPVVACAQWVARVADVRVVDGTVELVARAARGLGAALARVQTGETDVYASLVAVGFVVLTAVVVWLGGR